MNNLPENWMLTRLGDAADVFFSNVDKKSRDGDASVYLCNYMDVFSNDKITRNLGFMSATATDLEVKKFTLLEGDVVFTKDSEDLLEIGIPSYVAENIPGLVCGYHLGVARPRENSIGQYLYFAMQTNYVKKQLARLANGISRFGLGLNETRKLRIPLPPLVEQKRIVEILSDADAAIAVADKCLEKYKSELVSLTNTIISKHNDRYSKVPLGDLACFENGFGYRSDDILKDNTGYPLVSLANFCMGGGYKKFDRKTLKEKPGKRYQVNCGDLMIANTEVTRAGEIIGAPLIVPSEVKDIFFSTDVSKLHVSTQILPEYLEGVLMTSKARRHMRKMANGSTVLHLDISGASKFPIPVP